MRAHVVILRCMLALASLHLAGCCSSEGECGAVQATQGLGWTEHVAGLGHTSPLRVEVVAMSGNAFTLSVPSAGGPEQRFGVYVKQTKGVFFVGQKLDLRHCIPPATRTDRPYMSLTDVSGRLLFVASSDGFNALDAACVPKGLRVERVALGCCGVEDECGGSAPIALRIVGDDEVTLRSGQEGEVKILGRTYHALNAYSVELGDDGGCTDRLRNIASYGLVLEAQ